MYCNKLLEEIETKIKRGFNTKILKTDNQSNKMGICVDSWTKSKRNRDCRKRSVWYGIIKFARMSKTSLFVALLAGIVRMCCDVRC